MATSGNRAVRVLKILAGVIAGLFALAVAAEEIRVRINNFRNAKEWERRTGKLLGDLTGLPPIDLTTDDVRALTSRAGQPFAGTGDKKVRILLAQREIDRRGRTYKDDAKAVYDDVFSDCSWEGRSFWFSGESRSAIVRGTAVGPDGSRRKHMVEFKRLDSNVLFAFSETSEEDSGAALVGDFAVSRLMGLLRSERDDPSGETFVECALCGRQVTEFTDKHFPVLWLRVDRTTEKPLRKGEGSESSTSLTPICGRCASGLEREYWLDMRDDAGRTSPR